MKWKYMLMAVFLGWVMPWLMFTPEEKQSQSSQETTPQTTAPQTTVAQTSTAQIPVSLSDGSVVSMELEDYVAGVVLGEMPADFPLEALKTQAVVARTFTSKMDLSGKKHTGYTVCTDPACCQAYCSVPEYLNKGGTQEAVDKVLLAVQQTSGQILLYGGELIEATYFSCSGGRTEDAQAVWGTEVSYLQAVDSPGEEDAKYYTDTVTFTCAQFEQLLGTDLTGQPENWIGEITYTDGGGVATILLDGQSFTGTQLRQKLGLRSTAFVITVLGDTITLTTKGFGHRVGMSQYGARAMATSGSEYTQILSHYYPGTTLSELN